MSASEGAPTRVWALVETPELGGWRRFRDPLAVLRADRVGDVVPLLEQVEEATREGLWAAGFLAYEAAPAFDPALHTRPAGALPLGWFGLFGACEAIDPRRILTPADGGFLLSPWEPSVRSWAYRAAVGRIRRWIAAGETYQINYTYRLRARFAGDPWQLFLALCRSQGRNASRAYLDTGGTVICSASPELFFRRDGHRIVCRPMKGTAPRGLESEDDDASALALCGSPKERAENVMIVDMVRNDLGRAARAGSVRASRLCEVERYPTVLQLTSTVEAEADAPLPRLLAALFPSASVTGAPKARATELIARLETEPRGVYTGAVGYAGPGREARFNVAIRTVTVDRELGTAEYGTGSGIVWDSRARRELAECRTKALILAPSPPRFSLLETVLWRPRYGWVLVDRHLERLAASARYFDFPCDLEAIRCRLSQLAHVLPPRPHRLRLLLDPEGEVGLEPEQFVCERRVWRVALAAEPVAAGDRFLYHKTTRREVYERALRGAPGCDDVVLWNEDGEVTESTVANLVLRLGGELVTPPVACGILPGTRRAELLAHGAIRERRIAVSELSPDAELWLVNSLRGWIRARLEPP